MPELVDLLKLGGALLAGGVAFGSFAALLRQVSRQLAAHIVSDDEIARDVIDRLARIETILTERK